ncbi:MAG: fibronectin type III domain-containing protein [Porticoccaceae bacterium]|nr:fibronectin type III domain-containing protein [Porticoccaceae bacterium]
MPPNTISVYGHLYELQLQKNDTFRQQLSGKVSAQHYRGQLAGQTDSWVRMSNVDGHWQGIVSLAGEVYLVDMPPQKPDAAGVARSRIMSANPVDDLPPVACGHPGHKHHRHPLSAEATTEPLVNPDVHSALQIPQQVQFNALCETTVDDGSGGQICLLAEMEFVFDEAFQDEFGANARAQAESLINLVEGFYRNDFGIIFDTLTLELVDDSVFDAAQITADPFDASDFLNHISDLKGNNSRLTFLRNRNALLHVVTGRNFEGGTAGIAFLDVVCSRFSSNGVGTSQLLGFRGGNIPLTAVVVAHEIGHNFGASHDGEGNDCPGSGFVMAPSVSSGITEFSSCSEETIQGRISNIFDEPRAFQFADPLSCFNFPADIAIVANGGNPTSAASGAEVALQYTISSSDAFRDVSQVTVSGSVPNAQGRFNSVTLNGQACTVAANNLSYSCTFDNPTASMTLVTNVAAVVASASFTQRVAVSNDSNIVDVNSTNDEVVSSLATDSSAAVPASASNLVASQINVNNVQLTWNDNSNNEDNFRIERRENGGSFTTLSTVAANSTSFIDTTTRESVSYGYRVIALNSNGDAVASNTVTILVVPAVPMPPSNLSATENANGEVRLTWTDNSSNESSFRIERRVGSGSFTTLNTLSANITSFTDTAVTAGTSYSYRVTARNSGGDSAASNVATITLSSAASVPDAPSRLGAAQGAGSNVDLSWTDNSDDEDNFRIERREGGGSFSTLATASANSTSFTDTTSQPGTDYSYRVIAVNSSGDSAASNEVNISLPDLAPSAPSGLSTSQGSGANVSLSWTDNSDNEDNFRVERRVGSGGFSALATLAANTTSYTDTTSVAGTSYGYRVIALNSTGDSPASNIASITPSNPTPPPAPAPAPSSGGGGSFGWLLLLMGALWGIRRKQL